MSRLRGNVAAFAVLGAVCVVPAAALTPPAQLPIPSLLIEGAAFPLIGFHVTSTTCVRTASGSGCVIADGGQFRRVPIAERIRAPVRGAIGVVLPAGTDAVSIWYGRQLQQSYDHRLGTIDWPVPGSGTYRMFITIASHDERTTSVVTYAVPIYAPRS